MGMTLMIGAQQMTEMSVVNVVVVAQQSGTLIEMAMDWVILQQ